MVLKKHMLVKFNLVMAFFISSFIHGQEANDPDPFLEKLKIELVNESDPLKKHKGYKQIAETYFKTELDSALSYINLAIGVSENFEDQLNYAEDVLLKSKIEYEKINLSEAIRLLNELLQSGTIKGNNRLLANAYRQLGESYAMEAATYEKIRSMLDADIAFGSALAYGKNVFTDEQYVEVSLDRVTIEKYLSDYNKALDNLLDLVDKFGDNDTLNIRLKSKMYNILGSVYGSLHKDDKTIEYVTVSKAIDTSDENTVICNWILGNAYKKQKKYTEAEKSFKNIEVTIYNKAVKQNYLHKAYTGLGEVYIATRDYNNAITYFNKALSYLKKNESKYPILQHESYNGLAKAYYNTGNVKQAKDNSKLSIKLLTENSIPVLHLSWKEGLVEAYELMEKIASDLGDFETSLSYLNKAESVKEEIRKTEDEIFNLQNSKIIEELTVAYQTKQKDSKIDFLTSQNELKDLKVGQQKKIVWIIAVSSFLFLLALVYVTKLLKQKKEANILLAQKNEENELLVKEIHHRVKNNLQIIQSLIGSQMNAKPDEKELLEVLQDNQNRVRSMAIIHQNLYQSNNFNSINAKKYFKDLLSQLKKTYVSDTIIAIETDIDDVIIKTSLAVPLGLIVNELVTNAFKYAFPKKYDTNNLIFVSFKWNDAIKKYRLEIKDNGIGFKKNMDFNTLSSFGMQLVHGLVDQLNGELTFKNKQGVKFDIYLQEPKTA